MPTSYQWGDASLVKRLDVLSSEKQSVELVIYAHEGVKVPGLAAFTQSLRDRGYIATPDMQDGTPVLRVKGAGGVSDVTALLDTCGLVHGAASTKPLVAAGEKSKSFAQKMRANSLGFSGFFYTLGNIALMASGLVRKEYNEVSVGSAWMLADLALMRYGEDQNQVNYESINAELLEHLDKEGIEIPKGNALTAQELGKKCGLIEGADNFMRKHVMGIKCGLEIFAGYKMIMSGTRPTNGQEKNPYRVVSGALIFLAWTVALLVPQKEKTGGAFDIADGNEEKPNIFKRAYERMQEKPYRVTGALTLLHNGSVALGAFSERGKSKDLMDNLDARQAAVDLNYEKAASALADAGKWGADSQKAAQKLFNAAAEERKSFDGKVLVAQKQNTLFALTLLCSAMMAVANGLFGMAEKGATHKPEDDRKLDELYASSAEIIMKQPEQLRTHLINRTAGMLSDKIHHSPAEIAQALEHKLQDLVQNPWAQRILPREAAPAGATYQL